MAIDTTIRIIENTFKQKSPSDSNYVNWYSIVVDGAYDFVTLAELFTNEDFSDGMLTKAEFFGNEIRTEQILESIPLFISQFVDGRLLDLLIKLLENSTK